LATIDWSYNVVLERGNEVTAGRWTSLLRVPKMTGPPVVTCYSAESADLCTLEQIASRKTFQRLVAGFLGRSRTALCPTEIAGPLVVTCLAAESADLCALEQIASCKAIQRLVAGSLGRSRTALCSAEIAGPSVVTCLTAETTNPGAIDQIASDKDEIWVVCRVHRASPSIVGTGNGSVAGRTHHDSVMCETLWL